MECLWATWEAGNPTEKNGVFIVGPGIREPDRKMECLSSAREPDREKWSVYRWPGNPGTRQRKMECSGFTISGNAQGRRVMCDHMMMMTMTMTMTMMMMMMMMKMKMM